MSELSSSLNDLAEELLDLVFAGLDESAQTRGKASLLNCARVNKKFNRLAIPQIYTTFPLDQRNTSFFLVSSADVELAYDIRFQEDLSDDDDEDDGEGDDKGNQKDQSYLSALSSLVEANLSKISSNRKENLRHVRKLVWTDAPVEPLATALLLLQKQEPPGVLSKARSLVLSHQLTNSLQDLPSVIDQVLRRLPVEELCLTGSSWCSAYNDGYGAPRLNTIMLASIGGWERLQSMTVHCASHKDIVATNKDSLSISYSFVKMGCRGDWHHVSSQERADFLSRTVVDNPSVEQWTFVDAHNGVREDPSGVDHGQGTAWLAIPCSSDRSVETKFFACLKQFAQEAEGDQRKTLINGLGSKVTFASSAECDHCGTTGGSLKPGYMPAPVWGYSDEWDDSLTGDSCIS